MRTKQLFLILLVSPLVSLAVSETNTICKSTNSIEVLESEIEVSESQVEEKPINKALLDGTLRKKADQHYHRLCGDDASPANGKCKTLKTHARSTIRDKGKKVGVVKTHKTAIGVKSELYDNDGDKIGSVHKVGVNKVYRDADGKRISRRKAKKLGLR